ncbi:LysR family transcriptional regulator [Caryophanon latum]|uniref:LysR family transcriptional regulator n=1 Tax=Caryophanon latum TaxID=33977 RepID=A0A1C0YTN3_9BACL|nr:LysR family transcriptional regulator [Caryophanon latum]
MSLVKYEILDKVGQEESFTKAAEQLGLTQSAVSHAISSLEKEFGFALIHRGRGGVKLTTEGEMMLVEIRKVLAAQESLAQEAANILGFARGKVRIGVISSISSNWMPTIIQLMEEHYPQIAIELFEGDYYEIAQWIYSGQIDCGFLNEAIDGQYDFMPLVKDRLLCIVPEQHELAKERYVKLDNIANYPFIMISYNGNHDIERLFNEAGVKPNIRFKLYEEMGILSMVSHHLGITILPELVLNKNMTKNLIMLPLQNDSYRTIGLVTKKTSSPATKKFVEVLMKWLDAQQHVIRLT